MRFTRHTLSNEAPKTGKEGVWPPRGWMRWLRRAKRSVIRRRGAGAAGTSASCEGRILPLTVFTDAYKHNRKAPEPAAGW